jgi:hypothetical protein
MSDRSEIDDRNAAEFDADFRKHGYRAETMHVFRSQFRHTCSEYFTYAADLNVLAQKSYIAATELLVERPSQDPLCVGIQIMPRVLSSFQAAIDLAEQGMHIESLTLTRCVYEAAFWIGYLHEEREGARDHLFSETLRQDLEVHRLTIDSVKHDETALADKRAAMARLGNEYRIWKRKPVSIEAVAGKSGFRDRYPEYRYLCGLAAHVNLGSIIHYIAIDEAGSYTGHVIGPNQAEVPRAVMLACTATVIAVEALRRLTKSSDFDVEFGSLLDRSLPLNEAAAKALDVN